MTILQLQTLTQPLDMPEDELDDSGDLIDDNFDDSI